MENSAADRLPADLIHHIFSFLTSPVDIATASLLNKHWYTAEGSYRRAIKVRNCFAFCPRRLFARRFSTLSSLTLVGRPHVFEFRSKDVNWRVSGDRWIECIAARCGGLQSLKLKRFVLSHRSMMQISRSFPDLRSLVFVGCEEIPAVGLGLIVSGCRLLQVLELRDCCGMSDSEPWLMDFPENCDSLESLIFRNVKGELDVLVLERMASRCPNLKCLKLDEPLPPDVLTRMLEAAPQLVELGFGTFRRLPRDPNHTEVRDAVVNCTSVQCLSGAWCPDNFKLMTPLCSNLLFLDLTKIGQRPMVKRFPNHFIKECYNLQRLWVLNSIGDAVLRKVGSTCKRLKELKILPQLSASENDGDAIRPATVTENGLRAIAEWCHELQSVSYTSVYMSNATLVTLARNNPDIKSFELNLLIHDALDYRTSASFDEGVGAIFQSCKNLNRLSICNAYVTDQVFFFAGMFGAQLKKLSVVFGGDSTTGIFYALNFCSNLRQLVIKGPPFGDAPLLAAAKKFKNLQFIWLGTGGVTVNGSKTLSQLSSEFSVGIMDRIGKTEDLSLEREVCSFITVLMNHMKTGD